MIRETDVLKVWRKGLKTALAAKNEKKKKNHRDV